MPCPRGTVDGGTQVCAGSDERASGVICRGSINTYGNFVCSGTKKAIGAGGGTVEAADIALNGSSVSLSPGALGR